MTESLKILSDITIFMKYAKYIPELQRRETWDEIVTRNMTMHISKFPFLEKDIKDAYRFVFDKKALPSMRSMQFAGKPIEKNNSRIYNCSYVPIDDYRSFSEAMFLLLGGCGVGYSVQSHHVEKLPEIRKPRKEQKFMISDDIEGWSTSIRALMSSYFGDRRTKPRFDFSDIRPKGSPLKTAGGKAPGPEPLKECLFQIEKILDRKDDGDYLNSTDAHDIMCHIADSVLSGGIRRASLVSLFDFDDYNMTTSKYGNWWELHPQRALANNSAVILRHKIKRKEFFDFWGKIKASGSGEPGIYFSNDKDSGANPCLEISLKSNGLCNLTEVNVGDLESQQDFEDRVRAAALIGTLQASYTDFHFLRDIWKDTAEKEALIGVGLTGIASGNVLKMDLRSAAKVANDTNEYYANQIGINKAARVTTVKPSGTSSLVLGCSSGIHAYWNKYYIRHIRVNKNEAIYTYLLINHPELVEDEYFKPQTMAVIKIPVKAPDGSIYRTETALDTCERVAKFNEEWVREGHRRGHNTNNVSATISVRDHEWRDVGEWMWKNKERFNGLSVLPYDNGSYKQAPHENITKERYDKMVESLSKVDLTKVVELVDQTDLSGEAACAGNKCEIV